MPTSNPRINVTLQPSTHARLLALSHVTGNSMSNLVATLLDSQAEVFDRLIVVLEAADKAKREAQAVLSGGELAAELAKTQERIEQQLGLVFDLAEGEAANLLEKAEAVQRRGRRATAGGRPRGAPAGSGGGSRPPSSNRGVRSGAKAAKKSGPTRT